MAMDAGTVLRIFAMKDHGVTALECSMLFDVHAETVRRIWKGENYRKLTRQAQGDLGGGKTQDMLGLEIAQSAKRMMELQAAGFPEVTTAPTPIPEGARKFLSPQVQVREAVKGLKESLAHVDQDEGLPDASVNPWA